MRNTPTKIKKWRRFALAENHLDSFLGHVHLFGRLWYRTAPYPPPMTMLESAKLDDDWWAKHLNKCVLEAAPVDSSELSTELVTPLSVLLPEAYAIKGANTFLVSASPPERL